MTRTTARAFQHRQNLLNKAQRAMPIIDEWAANLTADGTSREAAYTEIRRALDGTSCRKAQTERFWWMLATEHARRNPHYTHRGAFNESREFVLANIDTRIAAARAQTQAECRMFDPFAGLTA